MKRRTNVGINNERCAGGCGKKRPAKFSHCASCRAGLPKPETICAGCAGPSFGNLFCNKCGAALIADGEKLAAQERYNKLTGSQKRSAHNPQYSGGQFPLIGET